MSVEKKVFRSGPYADLIAQGVQAGESLYLSGQVGMREDGSTPDNIVEQVTVAYANIASVLAEFGATMDNIVDETFLVTDVTEAMTNLEAIFAARQQAYGQRPDVTQTLIGVAALLLPELKIEIKCVAHL
ncbi:putative translation initiation inhibitor,yjgFfamily [gamma proteobacterium NOR5-3]|nr:putative translation initiation inhibitor,yjgFfamily [gamma proteobacterium NOR5-3]